MAQEKETHGGVKTAAVFGMIWPQVLLPEVHEGACVLDEALVEGVFGASDPEPEVLEDVVGFIIIAGVETSEIAEVVRIQVLERIPGTLLRVVEGRHELGDALIFFHGLADPGRLSCRSLCLTRYDARF